MTQDLSVPAALLPPTLRSPIAFIVDKQPDLPDYGVDTGDLVIVDRDAEFAEGALSVFVKNKSNLTHEHFLQCACYIVALKLEKGILWNTRDNTSYKIRVPDKKKFLDAVAKTISKHAIASYYEPVVISPRPAGIPALKGELSKFTLGAKVNHTGFGNGTILQINSLNGSHIIDVKFDKGGARKLLLEMVVRSGMLHLVTEDTAESVEPEKPAKDPKQEQYEFGYEDVKDFFTQQTRIIRDRYKTRWVKCEKCGAIKQDVEYASYGGHGHVNLGICRDCSRKAAKTNN